MLGRVWLQLVYLGSPWAFLQRDETASGVYGLCQLLGLCLTDLVPKYRLVTLGSGPDHVAEQIQGYYEMFYYSGGTSPRGLLFEFDQLQIIFMLCVSIDQINMGIGEVEHFRFNVVELLTMLLHYISKK